MAKPPPYPPKAMGPKKPLRPKPKATPMGKMMGKAIGKKVDPSDYMSPKPKTKLKGPQSEGARPMFHHMQKMPKQTGPKKTSKMRKY